MNNTSVEFKIIKKIAEVTNELTVKIQVILDEFENGKKSRESASSEIDHIVRAINYNLTTIKNLSVYGL